MRFQCLEEWLDWQSCLNPKEIDLGLERVTQAWRRLRPDGLSAKVVTVAGTNGKGSSVAMLEAICLRAGYRVGAYTSPHLIRYNERIRLDGAPVADAPICRAFERIDQARAGSPLTYFEFGTLAALEIFAEEALDLVILEVGLGGRLDAVNIIDADVALITTVDLDHMDWLGETREQIGREKAGIMRAGRPVVLAQPEMPESVLEHARGLGSVVYQAGRDFSFMVTAGGFDWWTHGVLWRGLPRPHLSGPHQFGNAAAVLMVCRLLGGEPAISQEQAGDALRKIRLAGRLEYFEGDPPLLLDVAHNPQAVSILRDSLAQLRISGHVHAVFGLLADKDAAGIASIMDRQIDHWHLIGIEGGRGQSAQSLHATLRGCGLRGELSCHDSLVTALASARAQAHKGDLILIFGSFVVVGEALQRLRDSSDAELV